MGLFAILSISYIRHNNTKIMLSVIMLSVVILSVVAP